MNELSDSRERAGARVLWLSCDDQIDAWELFPDNSYLSAILDRQELPDSRKPTGAPVLWLSCGGPINVWEMFSDNSYLSAIIA